MNEEVEQGETTILYNTVKAEPVSIAENEEAIEYKNMQRVTGNDISIYNYGTNPIIMKRDQVLVPKEQEEETQRGKLIKKYKHMSVEIPRVSPMLQNTRNVPFVGIQQALRSNPELRVSQEAMDAINNFMTDIAHALVDEVVKVSRDPKDPTDAKVFVGPSEVKQAIVNILQPGSDEDMITPKHLKITSYYGIVDRMSKSMEELVNTNEGWTSCGMKEGVATYKKSLESSMIQCSKGVGEIKAPPIIIRNVIRHLTNAGIWYPLFESAKLIESIDKNTEVWHWKFSARVCVLKQQRDFVIVRHRYDRSDGSYVMVAQSVEHKSVPPLDGYTRGEILTSGFLIQPKPGDPSTSIVTYVANVDPKGNLPELIQTKFLSLIADRQPLLVASLRKYMEEDFPREQQSYT